MYGDVYSQQPTPSNPAAGGYTQEQVGGEYILNIAIVRGSVRQTRGRSWQQLMTNWHLSVECFELANSTNF